MPITTIQPQKSFYLQNGNSGLPWWSSGWDSALPVQGTWDRCLVKELDPTCRKEYGRSLVLQLRPGAAKWNVSIKTKTWNSCAHWIVTPHPPLPLSPWQPAFYFLSLNLTTPGNLLEVGSYRIFSSWLAYFTKRSSQGLSILQHVSELPSSWKLNNTPLHNTLCFSVSLHGLLDCSHLFCHLLLNI